jgi:hypothetical protein
MSYQHENMHDCKIYLICSQIRVQKLRLNDVTNRRKRRNRSSFARLLYWFNSNRIKIVQIFYAWKVFYDSFFAHLFTWSVINVFRDRFVRCKIAKSIKREHVRIVELFRVQSKLRKRSFSYLSKFSRTSYLKTTREVINFALQR